MTGTQRGNVAAASSWQYVAAAGRAPASSTACTTTGDQRVAVVLVSFPTRTLTGSITPSLMNAAFFGGGLSLDTYLREVSNGRASASGVVVGPVMLDADYFNQPIAVRDAAIRAASGLVDFTAFSRIALVVPQSATGLTSGGMATIGCETLNLPNSQTTIASTTWLGDASLADEPGRVATAVHETGHNLGLQHAQAADFGAEPIGPPGQLPAPYDQTHDYGDSFSNMGRNLGQWAAPHKAMLGWLDSSTEITTVQSTGSFTLRPYEEGAAGVKALKIRRGTGNNAWLWLENRQPLGTYDSRLAATAFTGAMVHVDDDGWGAAGTGTHLVRFNADSAFLFNNAPLTDGATFTDPYTNLSLTVTRLGDGALTVNAAYAAAPTCPSTLTPATIRIDPAGGNGAFDIAAPGGCAWTVTSPAPWITFTSATSGTGDAHVTFTAGATPISGDRWTRLNINAGLVVILQAGLDGHLSLDPVSANFSAAGGTSTFDVATNTPDYAWSYVVNADWILNVFPSRQNITAGADTLRYDVAANTTGSARTGTITVDAQTFTVTQAAGAATAAKVSWQQLSPPSAPDARIYMTGSAFGTNGGAVLFGGSFDTFVFNDTWVWNGSAWSNPSPAHSPGAAVRRSGSAMAYDALHGQAVLFGGFLQGGGYDDATWTWDGSDWTQRTPAHRPPARYRHAMAYHAATGKVVLFGGEGDAGALSDTWEWNGSDWTQKTSASVPLARLDHTMAYDEARGEIVLFGGVVPASPPVWRNDTWVWDGTAWTQRAPAVSPSARQNVGLAYHPGLGQVILVGGVGAINVSNNSWNYSYRQETWGWNGAEWTQLFPDVSPFVAYSYLLWFDPVHNRLMAHVGDSLFCNTRGPTLFSMSIGAGSLLLGEYSSRVSALGQSASVAVTSSTAWSATTSTPWLTITGGASGSGNGAVSYSASANPSGTLRTGRITIGDKILTVQQSSAITFTDDPLTVGATSIKALHFTELRQAIDILRARYGLSGYSWTDSTLVAGTTTIRAAHLSELRIALADAYAGAGLAAPTYTHATIASGTSITALDIAELRARVMALW